MTDDRDPRDFTQKDIMIEFILPALKEIREGQDEDRKRISALEKGNNMLRGALLFIVLAMIPLSVPVVATLLPHHP